MTLAEIDALSATDEYAARLIADVDTGLAHLTTDPTAIRRRFGGCPRVGGRS